MADNEYNKFNHLSLIQGIISRLASNSFMIKGWLVAILTGSLALSDKIATKIPCLPLLYFSLIILFWISDAYFLYLERKYREKYNKVNELRFINYNLTLEKKTKLEELSSYLNSYFAISKVIFYFPLIAIICFLIQGNS